MVQPLRKEREVRHHDPKEIGSAKLLLTDVIDKLAVLRGRLSQQGTPQSIERATEIHQIIEELERIQARL